MNPADDRLARILRKYALTQCPCCHITLTTTNVHVGWNPSAADDAVFPQAWLTCTQCEQHVQVVSATLPGGRFVQSRDEALDAFIDA